MNEANVANTAIRTLEILLKLSEKDCAENELADEFSDDTLRIYLNSLKNCGVKISSPSRVKREYSLLENFDFLNFSLKDYKYMAKIKNYFAQKNDYEMVMNINNLLVHLSKYTNLENSKKLLKIAEDNPFSPKYHVLIKELSVCIKNKQPILVNYYSPASAVNYFKILPQYIKTENNKTYLLGPDNSIKAARYMLIDRIKSIKILDEPCENFDIRTFAVCDFYGKEKDIEEFQDFEITDRTKDKITAKIYYENEFTFLQKVLSFGKECVITEPTELKKVLLSKIKQTEVLYEENV